jgi:hypothetical protein
MSVDFYTLRKKGVKVFRRGGRIETVTFLQLVIRNALSQEAQGVIDAAIKSAFGQWETTRELPEMVVQVGRDGTPGPGSPIYRWGKSRRVYCFDDELLEPVGYLGERELSGFLFRTVREQEWINDVVTARKIDEGGARVYKDFWAGEIFKTGEEFLAYRRGGWRKPEVNLRRFNSAQSMLSPKLSKIVCLIRFIESKGQCASSADLQFLACLKTKAIQLGYSLRWDGVGE